MHSKKRTLKNILYVILILSVFAVGCGRKDNKTELPQKEPQAQNQSQSQADAKQSRKNDNNKQTKPSDNNDNEELPRPNLKVTQKDINLRWVDGSNVKMTATAKELVASEIGRNVVVKNFSANLYENGKVTATMTATKAFVDADTRIVTATDGVKISSSVRKTSVLSSWIKWYSKENRIVGNGGVKITSEMGTIDAPAFEADTALNKFTVKNSGKGL